MTHLRIILNFLHYFQDYRQFTRIYIKHKIKTISDLENYIAEVFHIPNKFYLVCQNYYLPPFENIFILDDNDTVHVIPTKSESTNSNICDSNKLTETKTNVCDKQTYTEDIPVMETDIFQNSYRKMESRTIGKRSNCEDLTRTCDKLKKSRIEKNKGDSSLLPFDMKTDSFTSEINNSNKKIATSESTCKNVQNLFQEENSLNNSKIIKHSDISENTEEENHDEVKNNDNNLLVQNVEILNDAQEAYSDISVNHATNRKSYSLNDVIDFERDKILKRSGRPSNENEDTTFKKCSLESIINDIYENKAWSGTPKQFITKRKRIRVRSRKRSNRIEKSSLNASSAQNEEYRPPKTSAAPTSHIRFDDHMSDIFENEPKPTIYQINLNASTDNFQNSTPVKELKENAVEELRLKHINPDVCPALKKPTPNTIIVFKKLKLGEDYSPQLSRNILAKIEAVDKYLITVTILEGHEELKQVRGKFSSIADEEGDMVEENYKSFVINVNELIDARIVKSV